MSDGGDIYQHDPLAASDDAFEVGRLAHLVPRNRGRMLDPRRTPVRIISIDEEHGFFEVAVEAFEDAGARWQLPLEDASHFQFELGASTLAESDVRELETIVARLDRPLEVSVSMQAHDRTLHDIGAERARIRGRLRSYPGLKSVDFAGCIRTRRGSQHAADAIESLLDEAGLAKLERSLTRTYVSNPHSGELVKGHAIVIAEMGLWPYVGKVVRNGTVFAGEASREHRRAHVVLRLAFLQELMAMIGCATVQLYRGTAVDRPPKAARSASLVSATFSREVAVSHFESRAEFASLIRRQVPVSRLFMTFLETSAMGERYLEAEAVMIGELTRAAP
jgi:hypothetical protein